MVEVKPVSDNPGNPSSPDRLRDLDARLKALRKDREGDDKADGDVPKSAMSGLGAAFRIGTELVGALIVGVGIGYFLDQWLGTTPWLMVVFFFLGSAAGVLNVYRAVGGREFGEGFQPKDTAQTADEGAERNKDGDGNGA